MDQIGAAAGISGPGVYRHFLTKQSLLVAIFDQVITSLQKIADQIVAESATPEEALRRLVVHHVDFAVDDRAVMSVYLREERSLAEMERRRIHRAQRAYIAHWREQVQLLHPGLPASMTLSVVQAAIAMVGSVAFYEPKVPTAELRKMLRINAIRLLIDPAPSGLA
jgi:AcrR family transcriptional regulator